MRFTRCWPYSVADMLFGGSSRPGGLNTAWVPGETHVLKSWLIYGVWAIFTGRGPYSVTQSGRSPGSSVGNTNEWILFLWSIVVISCLCLRSATSHSVQNTTKHHFFDPKHPPLTHKSPQCLKKSAIFCPMMRGIAK